MPAIDAAIVDLLPGDTTVDRTWGKVTQASPLKIQFRGDTASVLVTLGVSSYTPVLNDIVLLLLFGGQWIVIGKPVAR